MNTQTQTALSKVTHYGQEGVVENRHKNVYTMVRSLASIFDKEINNIDLHSSLTVYPKRLIEHDHGRTFMPYIFNGHYKEERYVKIITEIMQMRNGVYIEARYDDKNPDKFRIFISSSTFFALDINDCLNDEGKVCPIAFMRAVRNSTEIDFLIGHEEEKADKEDFDHRSSQMLAESIYHLQLYEQERSQEKSATTSLC